MSVYKKLSKNTMIFAVANMGSRIISLLLVPLYTYILTTREYGVIDTISVTIMLFLPIVTLVIYEATLRFTLKSTYDKGEVITNSLFLFSIFFVLSLLVAPAFFLLKIDYIYVLIIYIVLLLQSLSQIVSSFVRGIGEVKVFALAGFINTIILLITNIIFMVVFRWGIFGYYLAVIMSNIVMILYQVIKIRLWEFIRFNCINKSVILELITFSIPLVPNALMWWAMNASDRYIILLVVGASANGLYAVANKVPAIISIIHNIFFQAWQLSAIEEGDSKDKSIVFSNVFNLFASVMIIISSVLTGTVKLLFEMLFSSDFESAWSVTPFLILSIVFFGFSSFYGTVYIVEKKTKGAFKTSVIGAVINLILNIILIPRYGLYGAAIATMISSISMFIYRMIDTRKFIRVTFNTKIYLISGSLISAQIYTTLNESNEFFIFSTALMIVIVAINLVSIVKVIKRIKK